ncbi:uncharacterized protein TRUGW13939_11041 [Talaromyces rugulosus]|uniref:Serine peptidase n=1 Tax=Talaromyces rugulosus TaxID=121627 RepID=A0A7H8RBP4_TALRU|nr:uncharacterized protein TRUGW13939_11041 [Talaromyces rugulosus]QKX63870.1 hypothetical protein TRUGW13939_11041 [Talaromyces rugulosus]
MRSVLSLAAVCASWASVAAALHQIPLAPAAAIADGASSGAGTFEQFIDHDNPELGTFSQRYWWSDEYWNGPGSPIILFQPGESDADGFQGYLSNRTLTGLYAQEMGGAGLILEHRYYGKSSPVDTLTPKTMQHLTFKNALADTVNFAKNVKLPFDNSTKSSPDNAAWILVGGSYSGAQAGWTAAILPGTFWAYHASSAPVEAIWNYWQYFVPIQNRLPKNCTTDLTNVISHIDSILSGSDENAKQTLKEKFQLGDLRDDDFAAALANGPYLGQTTSASNSYGLYDFCNYIENVYAQPPANPGTRGVGVAKALEGYAQWWATIFPGYCASTGYFTSNTSTGCFDTYNATSPMYADTSIGNYANKQWEWLCCNEPFGAWQDGAPNGTKSIVSRLITDDYYLRSCGTYFQPDDGYTYAGANGKRSSAVNAWTQGWKGTTERVIWAQGQYDPWREETVSSDFRPGGPLSSSESNPIFVMKDASHCYDLILANAEENASVKEVVDAEVKQMKAWVAEFKPKNNGTQTLRRKLRHY